MPFIDYLPDEDQKGLKKFMGTRLRFPLWILIIFFFGEAILIRSSFPYLCESFFCNKGDVISFQDEMKETTKTSEVEKPSDDSVQTTKEVGKCKVIDNINEIKGTFDLENMENKNGFYYPNGRGGSYEGMLWFTNVLKANFDSITVEYEIKTENDKLPPSLIWSLVRPSDIGRGEIIAKLWIPEYSTNNYTRTLQLVGFAVPTGIESDPLNRDAAETIPEPVKRGNVDTLVISSGDLSGNVMTLNFKYNYISNRTNVTANPFPFTKIIKLPMSDSKTASDYMDFGIGTFVGNGIRIASLKICY